MIQLAMLNVIRDSIPIEKLLRAYLDETTDLIKEKEVKEEKKGISFSDKDNALTDTGEPVVIDAPKDIPTLEKISETRNLERKIAEAEEEEPKLNIMEDNVIIEVDDLIKKQVAPVETPIEVSIELPPESKPVENPIDLDIQVLN